MHTLIDLETNSIHIRVNYQNQLMKLITTHDPFQNPQTEGGC